MSRGVAVISFPGSNGDHDALDERCLVRPAVATVAPVVPVPTVAATGVLAGTAGSGAAATAALGSSHQTFLLSIEVVDVAGVITKITARAHLRRAA